MISFYSTKNPSHQVSLKKAVFQGLASEGGLFMPRNILPMAPALLQRIYSLTFSEMAFEIAQHFLQKAIPAIDLKIIVDKSMTFDAPLVQLSETIYALELFHGPTLSFKDFGARFMAQLMSYLFRHQDRDLHILAATSGDTGSAVAHGFLNVPGIKVWILYPKGQVSVVQEQQLTTIGHNVTALEIEGTFDDCQALVKQAFNDQELNGRMCLTSANSINIARLIPQSFYYFYAFAKLKDRTPSVVFSVPSGNFGNLTAGLFAKKMGLPVAKFIAATNANDTVPIYLSEGHFQPKPSQQTLSNAMDVGNPSNFARMLDLYQANSQNMRKDICGLSFTDSQTQEAIQEIYQKYQYMADPHGAIAYAGLTNYQRKEQQTLGIFLETAHPAKFLDVVEPLIGQKINIPVPISQALSKKKQTIELSKQYRNFKEFLFSISS